ncbi:MerR-like DNA binding protein [Kineococcus xinjiangensis]|uniref:MerR-like DNA binding protein n=1 Tax=Kineococcus xinjiangensis TaxID=512762 RepID=A0A2S6IDH9_9ACTN|nr:MerR-like DNA binding protein [Kineococcus xinjiangensis]
MVLRAVHAGPVDRVLGMLDAAHGGLDAERRGLTAARAAAASITGEPMCDVRPDDAMTVSELASALGVRASTLRHWEAEGLVVPDRDERNHRRYAPPHVRDARIVQQLRLAGYRVDALRAVLPHLARGSDLGAVLDARDRSITSRSLALLLAATHLHALLA